MNAELAREPVISLGAGVQSSAMLLLADDGRLPLDVQPRLAIFSDTQHEPPEVYEWLEFLRSSVRSIEIATVSAGDLLADATSGFNPIPLYALDDNGRPTIGQRQCTWQFKIRPLRSELRRREFGPKRPVDCLVGISIDEAERMKPSGKEWIANRWPLIDLEWNRRDCRDYVVERLGREPTKSACYFCPFKSDREFYEMREADPETFAKAVAADEAMRPARTGGEQFVSRSLIPLVDVAEVHARQPQLDLWQGECEGFCGV